MYEATSRALKKVPLHIPLPLYARNVGRHDKAQECNGAVSALLSDYIGMTFCIKGAGKAFLFQESFSMHEGDVYYPNEAHRFKPETEDCQTAWIDIDGPLAMSVFASYRFPRLISLKDGFPYDIYRDLLKLVPREDPVSVRQASFLIFSLFEYFGESLEEKRLVSRDPVVRALEYIDNNLSNFNLNVNDVCSVISLNRSTFSVKFMERMHLSPSEYIRNRRHSRARKLLTESNLSIGEIGAQCGFPDRSSFCRFFNLIPGLIPGTIIYKNQLKRYFFSFHNPAHNLCCLPDHFLFIISGDYN